MLPKNPKGWIAVFIVVALSATAGIVVGATSGADGSAADAKMAAVERLAHSYGIRAAALIRKRRTVLHGSRVRQARPPDPLAIAAMRNVSMQMAVLNDEPHPFGGLVWSANRKAAEALDSGAKVNTDQPVYIAVLHGNFVGNLASIPPGGSPPVGHSMSITFDATTLEVTDWGIAPAAPNLGSLGEGISLGT